jgi:hypothetical protein
MNRVQALGFSAAHLSASPAFAHGFGHGSPIGGANSMTNRNMLRSDANLVRLNGHNRHDVDRNRRDGRRHEFKINQKLTFLQIRRNERVNRLNQARLDGNFRLAFQIQRELSRVQKEIHNRRLHWKTGAKDSGLSWSFAARGQAIAPIPRLVRTL